MSGRDYIYRAEFILQRTGAKKIFETSMTEASYIESMIRQLSMSHPEIRLNWCITIRISLRPPEMET